MTFKQLVSQFTYSRGGLILGAAAFATIIRCVRFDITLLDLYIVASIIVLWPVFEYVAHRWLMHEWTISVLGYTINIWTPFKKTHDRHHANPTPETGLPDLWVFIVYHIIPIIFGIATPILSTISTIVLWMLLLYEFVHYSCHTNYRPNTWIGWAIRANHLGHHNRDASSQYAMLFPIFKSRK